MTPDKWERVPNPGVNPAKLRAERIRRCLTQPDAAGQLGVCVDTWCRWERGHTWPRGAILRLLEKWWRKGKRGRS